MKKGTHGSNELTFDKLDFPGQARAINGTVSTLKKEINAHLVRASEESRDVVITRQTFIDLLDRLKGRLLLLP